MRWRRPAGVLDEPRYLIAAAARPPSFILREMRRDDGRLLHSWRNGQAKLDAYLDDYACLANALVSAVRGQLQRALDRRRGASWSISCSTSSPIRPAGGFFYTAIGSRAADRAAQGPVRQHHAQRQLAGRHCAVAARQTDRPRRLSGRGRANAARRRRHHAAVADGDGPDAARSRSCTWARRTRLVLVGDIARDDTKQAIAAVHRRHLPRSVFACSRYALDRPDWFAVGGTSTTFFDGKESPDGQPVLYVCARTSPASAPAVGAGGDRGRRTRACRLRLADARRPRMGRLYSPCLSSAGSRGIAIAIPAPPSIRLLRRFVDCS